MNIAVNCPSKHAPADGNLHLVAPLSRGPWCRNSFANISMLAVAHGHAAWRVDALGSKTAPAPLFGGVRGREPVN
jgi:hypothetical protein